MCRGASRPAGGSGIWPKVFRSEPKSSQLSEVMPAGGLSLWYFFHSGLVVMLGESPAATATPFFTASMPTANSRCLPSVHQPSSTPGEFGKMPLVTSRPETTRALKFHIAPRGLLEEMGQLRLKLRPLREHDDAVNLRRTLAGLHRNRHRGPVLREGVVNVAKQAEVLASAGLAGRWRRSVCRSRPSGPNRKPPCKRRFFRTRPRCDPKPSQPM